MTLDFAERRDALVDRLAERRNVSRQSTFDAMRAVPREAFVRDGDRSAAYEDRPLQIADGQTISAPHMVAIMTDALALDRGERVLEVGTGCGYHAAVTAEVVGAENVYSVEYSDRLAETARETLGELGYDDVSVRVGDGRDGWAEHSPYDAAYLTCAASETGALDALLDDADAASDVAARTDLDAHAAGVLVDVLADRGFFDVVDGAYEPTNRALGLLTKTDLRSIGTTPRDIDRFDAYAALPETLTDDDPAASALDRRGEDHERNRLGAQQATPDAAVSAAVSAAQRTAPTAATVVAVGGSPGQHATEFAARGHDVTLRDTPGRIDAARPLLAPRDVELDPGALTDALSTTDLVFATDLTPRLDDTALDDFAATAHDALARTTEPEDTSHAPERALVLVEHLQDRSPRTATRRLDALATGHPGDHRTEAALRETLQTAGFQRVDVHAVPGLDAHAIAATSRST